MNSLFSFILGIIFAVIVSPIIYFLIVFLVHALNLSAVDTALKNYYHYWYTQMP